MLSLGGDSLVPDQPLWAYTDTAVVQEGGETQPQTDEVECLVCDGDCQRPEHKEVKHLLKIEGNWLVEELNGRKLQGDSTLVAPTLRFDPRKRHLSGMSGCNRYSGAFELLDENALKVGNLACTLMACPEPNVEREFLALLDTTLYYQIKLGQLHLSPTPRGKAVIIATRAPQ